MVGETIPVLGFNVCCFRTIISYIHMNIRIPYVYDSSTSNPNEPSSNDNDDDEMMMVIEESFPPPSSCIHFR
jgi:hypothetical protein